MNKSNEDAADQGARRDTPAVRRITRRQWLILAGGASVTVAAAGGFMLLQKSSRHQERPEPGRFALPEHPNHNPAYRAMSTPDDGVVVWTHQAGDRFMGYRFNANGQRIWRLCDGRRPPVQIAADYAAKTGRVGQEATSFVQRLIELGIVVAGGYVVTGRGFPQPPPGGSFHPRLRPEDPKTS